MPSNRTTPFFMDPSFMDRNSIKSGMRSKRWKDFVSKVADTESTASKVANSSAACRSAPIMPMGGQVLGVHLRQPERLIEQPTENTFQGFQFQLPWAPHLSGINIGTSNNSPPNTESSSSKARSVPFDYDVRLGPPEHHMYGTLSTDGKLPAIRMPSKCFSVIKRQERNGQRHPSSPLHFGLARFQSLSKGSVKRSHSEMVQAQEESEPYTSSGGSSCSNFGGSSSVKKKRFLKTADALQKSGLLAVTMESASLIQQNRRLQKEIEELKQETLQFLHSVFKNPENKHLVPVHQQF